jgi:hypothetical protein
MISMPRVYSVQIVHLSYTGTNTVSKRTRTRFHRTHVTWEFHRVRPKLFMSLWYVECKPCTYLALRLTLPNPRHLGVPLGASKTIYEPMVHWVQTVHLSCVKIALLAPHHLGVPSRASKTDCEPMVRLTKTEHLSCTDANTISKQIETGFHMTHIT